MYKEQYGWDISEGMRQQLTYVFFAPGYGPPHVGEKAVTVRQPQPLCNS